MLRDQKQTGRENRSEDGSESSQTAASRHERMSGGLPGSSTRLLLKRLRVLFTGISNFIPDGPGTEPDMVLYPERFAAL